MNDWLVPPARALLVGINAYDKSYITPLHGCVADVRAVQSFLCSRLGMATEDVRLLLSPAADDAERATRANIIAGIRDFLGGAPQGSHVLLYYSGHGARNRLASDIAFGDEWGESFVPCDARTDGVNDLIDRELRMLFGELADKGIHLTLIADSCHAGGTWRGDTGVSATLEPAARVAPDDLQPRTLSSLLDGTVSLDALKARYEDEIVGMTSLGAAQATQRAMEAPTVGGDGSVAMHGVMTTALLATLEAAGGPLSAIDLLRGVRARVAASGKTKQAPMLDGMWEAQLFGNEPVPRSQPLFVVSSVNGDGTVTIDGGTVDGVRVGAGAEGWADYGFAGPPTRWMVRDVTPRSATLVPTKAATAVVGQPMRVDLMAGRTVRFGKGRKQLAGLWESISDGLLLEVRSGGSDYTLAREGTEWVVRAGDGTELRRSPADRYEPGESLRWLNRRACFDAFRAYAPLDDERLSVPVGVGATNGLDLSAVWQGQQPSSVPAAFGDDARSVAAGSSVTITLQNRSNTLLYAMLYRLDAARAEVEGLWPAGRTNEVEPQSTVTMRYPMKQAGLATVRLVVSAQPHPMPRLPCGPIGPVRGDGGLRDLSGLGGAASVAANGWAAVDILIGQS